MTKSVKFLVLLLVMILPIAGALLIGPISFGAELSKSSIVDKVELDHTTLYQGEMTSIKVSFSDKENQKIKPGDSYYFNFTRRTSWNDRERWFTTKNQFKWFRGSFYL